MQGATTVKRLLAVIGFGLALTTQAEAACTVSTTSLAFGNYNPTASSPTDTASMFTISCTLLASLVTFTVSMSAGSSGSYAARQMSGGIIPLVYQIYTDAARTQIWGDGAGGTSAPAFVNLIPLTGGSASFPFYGRIPANQRVSPATYTDSIIITISY